MAKKNGISTFMNEPIGKTPTGAQNQGDHIDVTNFAKVNTGLGGSGAISTEMVCPLGKTPDGKKRDGFA